MRNQTRTRNNRDDRARQLRGERAIPPAGGRPKTSADKEQARPQPQAPIRPLTPYLALAGLIGPVLFVLAFSVAGFVRPGYSAMRDAVSDLGVGDQAWVQNANFFLFGILLVAFSIAFFDVMRHVIGRRSAIVSSTLIAVTGIGVFNSGIFTAAPETQGLHFLMGFLLAFGSAIATSALTGRRLRDIAGWEGIARYSRWTAIGAFALIALSFVALNPASPLEEAGIGGLIERALTVEVFAWHAVVGWRLHREARGT